MQTITEAAFLDIGSNSIRYMRASLQDGRLMSAKKQRMTTRLAENLLQSGRLSPQAVQRSLNAIMQFYQMTQAVGLPLYAYATSAARDAENREEFLSVLRGLPNFHLHLLSGTEEARYAFLGAAQNGTGCLVDIGGGSAQICGCAPDKDAVFFAESFPIGCVRAKEFLGEIADLDMAFAKARAWLAPLLPPAKAFPLCAPCYGVGGSITTLGALLDGQTAQHEKALHTSLTQENLFLLLQQLLALGAKRREHPLLKDRHDVIIPGGLVLLSLLSHFGIPALQPTHRDGLDGFAAEILRGQDCAFQGSKELSSE